MQLLTKTADYWTKIKHLPTNLWTGSQTTERTAILRSLFSCLLLWFDWAGEPCLVPPNPQSLDPISHSIRLRWCGWQRQDASIYLLYPLHSSRCSLGAFSLSTLFSWRLNSQQMFSAFVPSSWSQRARTFLPQQWPKNSKSLQVNSSLAWNFSDAFVDTSLLGFGPRIDFCNLQTWKRTERTAPDKVRTGFGRVFEVENECSTAGFWLSRAPVWSKPEP